MSFPPRLHQPQQQFDAGSSDAERKLASLMSQLETEMNSGSTSSSIMSPPVRKQTSEIILTPVAVATAKSPPPSTKSPPPAAKSPPPYHGPHITEFYTGPPHVNEGVTSTGKQAVSVIGVGGGFGSVAEAGATSPGVSASLSEPGTPVRTVTLDSEQRYGKFYLARLVCSITSSTGNCIANFGVVAVVIITRDSCTGRYC